MHDRIHEFIKEKNIALGMRTWKTILSVLICLFISRLILNWGNPSSMILAAMVAMQPSSQNSLESSKIRVLSSFIGAFTALGTIAIYVWLGYSVPLEFFLVALGLVIIIVACIYIDYSRGVIIACATFLTIFFFTEQNATMAYAIHRMIDTAIGCGVSIVVNKYVFPYNGHEDEDELIEGEK